MKFFIALFVVCGPLSIHAMNDDKKIGGGISGASKQKQFAKLTIFDCPAGSNPYFCLKRMESDQKEEKNRTSSNVSSKRPYSGHMNF